MKQKTIYDRLLKIGENKGAGFLCLIDPDKQKPEQALEIGYKCKSAGVDAILVGGSMMVEHHFNSTIKAIKNKIELPVIVFPGIFNFVSPFADAILFLSMMSSRNPQLLIGEQVRAAPLIKNYGVEAIPTGYFLIESGTLSSVQYMSHSFPIPRDKIDIALSHTLAAQYLGMKLIFFDAGSGAKQSVPEQMIAHVKESINIPLIVGGGIKTPEDARKKVDAGADFVVVGNVFENNRTENIIAEFSEAIHKTDK
ncbi:MAG: geranylgeranylglyceryl/heptaprenylglyceryl phosphate synthase [Candidatus Cloacimonadota bacterium]|nr:geranylgeranylglyceryl/heptaprenylglyceryl phosphate synthase [Candidatus Cloacimonadota bacterium]